MIKYKLTNEDMTTFKGCRWLIGEWRETSGEGNLCGSGWLHCYDDPLLAVLHNPIYGDFQNPKLWEVEAEGLEKRDGQLKCGHTRMRLLREIPLPALTLNQTVAYGILCALQVYKEESFVSWAKNWLNNSNRSEEAALEAASAARAASAAARASAWAAVWAARAASEASAAARAAWEAASAAWASVWAARAAAFNLLETARKALEL